jgi:hypothetical protein
VIREKRNKLRKPFFLNGFPQNKDESKTFSLKDSKTLVIEWVSKKGKT